MVLSLPHSAHSRICDVPSKSMTSRVLVLFIAVHVFLLSAIGIFMWLTHFNRVFLNPLVLVIDHLHINTIMIPFSQYVTIVFYVFHHFGQDVHI